MRGVSELKSILDKLKKIFERTYERMNELNRIKREKIKRIELERKILAITARGLGIVAVAAIASILVHLTY